MKAQSTINSTEGLMERQGTAAYNTAVDDSYHSTVAEDKLGQLGYFEGEPFIVDQRKSDPTVYDVWFCIGERNQEAIKAGNMNTCDEPLIIFVAYKTDRGPLIETVVKINTSRSYSLENTVKMRFAGIFEGIQKRSMKIYYAESRNFLLSKIPPY